MGNTCTQVTRQSLNFHSKCQYPHSPSEYVHILCLNKLKGFHLQWIKLINHDQLTSDNEASASGVKSAFVALIRVNSVGNTGIT